VTLLAALLVLVVVRDPGFFGLATALNIVRDGLVPLLFATGVLLVLISGGIDVSFLTVGILAAYTTCKLWPTDGPVWSVAVLFAVSVALGALLGLVNAAAVLTTRVSTLIATLATSAVFLGFMFAFIGGEVINDIPEPLYDLGRSALVSVANGDRGITRLSALALVPLITCLLVWALLRFSLPGRWIFAVGGDEEAARRIGVPVRATKVLVFVVAGAIAGLAGVVHVALTGRADPTTFSGGELNIIASVVLGGALITGGVGSVRGTVLGVVAIGIINQSLIPLGVPPIWQQVVVGVLLLLGVGLQAVTTRSRTSRPILSPDDPALRPVDKTPSGRPRRKAA
jgi:simple sugar transport system permease protein